MIRKLYKRSMVIFICLMGTHLSFAQKGFVDSLKIELQSDTDADTNTVKLLIKLADRMYRSEPDTAKMYSRRVVNLSKKIRFKRGEAEGNRYWGGAYFIEGKLDSALHYYKLSLELHKEIKDARGIAGAQASVGIVYAVQNQFKEAIFYFIEATKTYELIENYSALSVIYNNVGNLYLEQELFEEAYKNYLKGLEALDKVGNKEHASLIYSNIAFVLKELGRYEEALGFVKLGLSYAEQYDDQKSLSFLYLVDGNIQRELKEYEKALESYTKSYEILELLGNERTLVEIGYYRAVTDFELGNRREAKQQLRSVIEQLEQKEIHLPRLKSDSYQFLAQLENEFGSASKAVEYALLAKSISDSLYKEENLKVISEIQTKYETEKKEREIELLESVAESTILKLILGLSTAFALIIIISVIYWQNSKRKAKEKELELNAIQRELSNYGVLIAEKDSFLTEVIKQLRGLGKSLKTIESKKKLNSVIEELNHNTRITDDEEQLFQRIEQVNSGFFMELDSKFKKLSKSEKRLASLVQMGLSNKEIGGILQINSRSVVQARYRLKKKMNLGNEDLEGFLRKIATKQD